MLRSCYLALQGEYDGSAAIAVLNPHLRFTHGNLEFTELVRQPIAAFSGQPVSGISWCEHLQTAYTWALQERRAQTDVPDEADDTAHTFSV